MTGHEMTELLELELRDLGGALASPVASPHLAARVGARIQAERPRRAGTGWWSPPLRRSVVLALAALLLTAAIVTAAIGFGLPGLRILVAPSPAPNGSPSPTASTPSSAPGSGLGLGGRITLTDARNRVDFEILLPADPAIAEPDAVYLAGRRLSLVWAPRDELPGTAVAGMGLLLMEIEARVDEGMIQKLIDSGSSIERVDVDGAPGYWISGGAHELMFIGPDGRFIQDSQRRAGTTLAWTRDGITYRLEAEFTKEEALAFARTLR